MAFSELSNRQTGELRSFPPIRCYTWQGRTWKLAELHELMANSFDQDPVCVLEIFRRRLRAQMIETGGIDPFEARVKQRAAGQGGTCYRIDHLNRTKTDNDNIKAYVGITQTDLATRFSRHITQARRPRGPRSRDDSLPAAIRYEIEQGIEPTTVFHISFLESAETNEELVTLEAKWIDVIGSMTPKGYNIHPAGSLGGPSNSKPIEFDDDGVHHVKPNFTGAWLHFRDAYGDDIVPSITACRWRYKEYLNDEAQRAGKTTARSEFSDRVLSLHWVFGVDEDIPDGRQGNTPCTVDANSTRASALLRKLRVSIMTRRTLATIAACGSIARRATRSNSQ